MKMFAKSSEKSPSELLKRNKKLTSKGQKEKSDEKKVPKNIEIRNDRFMIKVRKGLLCFSA